MDFKQLITVVIVFVVLDLPITTADRFCKITASNNSTCGKTIKSGKCDVLKLPEYEYLLNDYALVSMYAYQHTILNKFDNIRKHNAWSMAKKRDIRTYSNVSTTTWHPGMEILAENIAKRSSHNMKANYCIQIESYKFSHVMVTMEELDQYDFNIFLVKAIENMMNYSSGASVVHNQVDDNDWGVNLFFAKVTEIGCAVSKITGHTYNEISPNHHLHCVFNVDNTAGNFEFGDSCLKCVRNQPCNKIFAYICT